MTTCCECGKKLAVGYEAVLKIRRVGYGTPKENCAEVGDTFQYELTSKFTVCKDHVKAMEKRLNMRDL